MAKKKFNIGMAALGALAAGIGGKYIYDKFGNKSPVAKKAAAAKADASSKPASEGDTLSASRNTSPSGMAAGMKAERSVPVPETPAMSPAPAQAQAQVMMPPAMNPGLSGYNNTDDMPKAAADTTHPQYASQAPTASPELAGDDVIRGMRRGGMVDRKASKAVASNKGLSVRGGGKATKGLGKVRLF